MNVRLKTRLMLTIIFILGIALGAIASGTIIQHRYKEIRHPHKLLRILEKVIQPDANQQQRIQPIVQEVNKRLYEIRRQCRRDMAVLIDSLYQKLAPQLTIEQQERFKNQQEKMKKFKKQSEWQKRHIERRKRRKAMRESQVAFVKIADSLKINLKSHLTVEQKKQLSLQIEQLKNLLSRQKSDLYH